MNNHIPTKLEIQQEVSMSVGTTIDKWLRDNPEVTAKEAGNEFLRRYYQELSRRYRIIWAQGLDEVIDEATKPHECLMPEWCESSAEASERSRFVEKAP